MQDRMKCAIDLESGAVCKEAQKRHQNAYCNSQQTAEQSKSSAPFRDSFAAKRQEAEPQIHAATEFVPGITDG